MNEPNSDIAKRNICSSTVSRLLFKAVNMFINYNKANAVGKGMEIFNKKDKLLKEKKSIAIAKPD